MYWSLDSFINVLSLNTHIYHPAIFPSKFQRVLLCIIWGFQWDCDYFICKNNHFFSFLLILLFFFFLFFFCCCFSLVWFWCFKFEAESYHVTPSSIGLLLPSAGITDPYHPSWLHFLLAKHLRQDVFIKKRFIYLMFLEIQGCGLLRSGEDIIDHGSWMCENKSHYWAGGQARRKGQSGLSASH